MGFMEVDIRKRNHEHDECCLHPFLVHMLSSLPIPDYLPEWKYDVFGLSILIRNFGYSILAEKSAWDFLSVLAISQGSFAFLKRHGK